MVVLGLLVPLAVHNMSVSCGGVRAVSSSAYNRAKQIVRRFLWVVVVLGLLVPLAVHNMRVSCGGVGAVSSSCCS